MLDLCSWQENGRARLSSLVFLFLKNKLGKDICWESKRMRKVPRKILCNLEWLEGQCCMGRTSQKAPISLINPKPDYQRTKLVCAVQHILDYQDLREHHPGILYWVCAHWLGCTWLLGPHWRCEQSGCPLYQLTSPFLDIFAFSEVCLILSMSPFPWCPHPPVKMCTIQPHFWINR